jgi:hypothetical protein
MPTCCTPCMRCRTSWPPASRPSPRTGRRSCCDVPGRRRAGWPASGPTSSSSTRRPARRPARSASTTRSPRPGRR